MVGKGWRWIEDARGGGKGRREGRRREDSWRLPDTPLGSR